MMTGFVAEGARFYLLNKYVLQFKMISLCVLPGTYRLRARMGLEKAHVPLGLARATSGCAPQMAVYAFALRDRTRQFLRFTNKPAATALA